MGDHLEVLAPPWACSQWGQYEHDWLDCPDCLQAYEKHLEDEVEDPFKPDQPIEVLIEKVQHILMTEGGITDVVAANQLAAKIATDCHLPSRATMVTVFAFLATTAVCKIWEAVGGKSIGTEKSERLARLLFETFVTRAGDEKPPPEAATATENPSG